MNDQDRTKVQGSDRQAQADRDIIYAFAYCEAKIEQVGRSSGIPFTTIATKVADLLYVQVGRLPLGTVSEMSTVRRGTTITPKRLPKVAVARGSYGSGARRVKGKVKRLGKGKAEAVVIQTFREAGVALRPVDLAKRAGIAKKSANSALYRMVKKGLIRRSGDGYQLAAA